MSARHHLAIGPMPTAEEMAAIRRRLIGTATVINLRQRPEMPVEKPREPADAHVIAYREHKALEGRCTTPGSYIRFLCVEKSVSYETMMGRRRTKQITAAKHWMIWKVKQRFPRLSMPQIGRLFGNLDHTSVFCALKKYGYVGTRKRLTEDQIAEIKRMHGDGVSPGDIARHIQCHINTVRSYTDPSFRKKQIAWNACGRQAKARAR